MDGGLTTLDPYLLPTPPTFNSTAASVGLLERTKSPAATPARKPRNGSISGSAAPARQATGPKVVFAAPDAEAILDASACRACSPSR